MIDPGVFDALRAAATIDVIEQGRRLIGADAVEVLDDPADSETVYGRVFDSGVHAVALSAGGADEMFAFCSCGRSGTCAHLLAFAFVVRPREPVPGWRKVLDSALPPPSAEVPIALFLGVRDPRASRTSWGRREPHLAVRPGVMGKRGAWIKGSSSWSNLEQLGTSSRVTGLLKELAGLYSQQTTRSYYYSYGPPDEWMALDRLPSRNLWSLLQQLQEHDVSLISDSRSQPAADLDDDRAQTRLTVTTKGATAYVDGEVIIDGEVTDPARLYPIGDPVVAVGVVTDAGGSTERISLLSLPAPVPATTWGLIARKSRLRLASADLPVFDTEYLPRLRGVLPPVSPDGSYDVPAAVRTTLVLTLAHAGGQVQLTWGWRRDRSGPDRTREREIVAAVREAAGSRAPLLYGDAASAGADPVDRVLGRANAVLFLTEVLPALRSVDGLEIVEESPAPQYRSAEQAPVVSVGVQEAGNDWFDLHITVALGDEVVEFEHLFTALAVGDPICVLPSGTFFPLDDPEFDRLRAIIDEARALSDRPSPQPRISRYATDLWSELADLSIVATQETEWLEKVAALGADTALELVPVPPTLSADLREYQHSGLAWLEFLRRNRLGGVLADDMGLGKTLQTIAMMECARSEDAGMAPFLVVAPTSVVPNWQRECERFAPGLRVVTVPATVAKLDASLPALIEGAHVVVTTYALFRLDFDRYRDVAWSGAIFDEAQLIKNHTSTGYRCARQLNAPFTLVVTGTPMENNLLELWALVSLACPGLLGNRTRFTDYFRTPIEKNADADRLTTLQRRLRPFMLRRKKEEVAAELPAKQEQVLSVELVPAHRRIYDRRLQRERQKVLGLIDDVAANRFQIFRSLSLLRQLALDSELVDEEPTPSAKITALIDILREAAAEGHRVLVLSQFTRYLTKARAVATSAGIASAYLDGSTRDRGRVIESFTAGEMPAFFVSLKAGGFGLNLTAADYVVLLDPWWNPAAETQAIDRTHRIGQTRSVMVYRLMAVDTIEQRVMNLQARKRRLFADVLDGAAADIGVLTADDIRGLIE